MWLFEKPIAHRGLHNKTLTENSMGAFRNAVEHGYNIETDVHLLKSGEVVVFHDNSLLRVCGKAVKIADLTLEDIKSDKYLLPSGEHLPLFQELLDLLGNGEKSGLLLELKFANHSGKLEQAVYDMIKGKEAFIAVQCFIPWTMIWFRKHAPEFYQGILSTAILLPLALCKLKKMQPDFVAYDITCIRNPFLLRAVKKHHYKLLSWTIRSEAQLKIAKSVFVNNIIFEKIDLDAINFKISDLNN